MESIPTTTGPIRFPSARRASELARLVGLAIAIAVVELALARGVVQPQISKYVYLFVALFVVAGIFRFPLPATLLFFAFTDFVFYPTYFAQNVGSLSVRPHEVILGCLLLLAFVRPKRQTWGGLPGAALAAFLALLVLAAVLAVQSGATSITEALAWGRPMFLLTVFYVIVRLFPSAEDRRLILKGTVILAAVAGVISLAVALGASFGSSLQAPSGQLIREEEGSGSIERVRLAGLSAGYALFWYCATQIAARRGSARLGWMACLTGICIAIVVSFNRNMWLGLGFGAILIAVYGGRAVRHRMALAAAVTVGGLAALMFFGSSSTNNEVVQPLVKRGETILNPGKTRKENSLEDRERETREAMRTVRSHLLLGVGPGAPFGVYMKEPITSGTLVLGSRLTPQLFLHNQYLYLVLIAGLPGLVCFVVFLLVPALQGLRRSPRDPMVAACSVGILMIMMSAVVAIYFTVEDMTAVLGLLTGIVIADFEGPAAEHEASGLAA